MFISSDKKQMERGQVPVSVMSQRAIKYSLIQDVLTSFLQGIVMSSTVILHWERRQGFRKASLTSLQNNCEQFPEYLIAFLCSSFFGPPRTAVAAFFFFSSSLPTFFLEHWCCQVLNYQVIFHLSLKGLETMIFHKSVLVTTWQMATVVKFSSPKYLYY